MKRNALVVELRPVIKNLVHSDKNITATNDYNSYKSIVVIA